MWASLLEKILTQQIATVKRQITFWALVAMLGLRALVGETGPMWDLIGITDPRLIQGLGRWTASCNPLFSHIARLTALLGIFILATEFCGFELEYRPRLENLWLLGVRSFCWLGCLYLAVVFVNEGTSGWVIRLIQDGEWADAAGAIPPPPRPDAESACRRIGHFTRHDEPG